MSTPDPQPDLWNKVQVRIVDHVYAHILSPRVRKAQTWQIAPCVAVASEPSVTSANTAQSRHRAIFSNSSVHAGTYSPYRSPKRPTFRNSWECRLDGTVAERVDGSTGESKKVKPPRTHWDMLIERRTIADLEEVLAERLDALRSRRGVKSA